MNDLPFLDQQQPAPGDVIYTHVGCGMHTSAAPAGSTNVESRIRMPNSGNHSAELLHWIAIPFILPRRIVTIDRIELPINAREATWATDVTLDYMLYTARSLVGGSNPYGGRPHIPKRKLMAAQSRTAYVSNAWQGGTSLLALNLAAPVVLESEGNVNCGFLVVRQTGLAPNTGNYMSVLWRNLRSSSHQPLDLGTSTPADLYDGSEALWTTVGTYITEGALSGAVHALHLVDV